MAQKIAKQTSKPKSYTKIVVKEDVILNGHILVEAGDVAYILEGKKEVPVKKVATQRVSETGLERKKDDEEAEVGDDLDFSDLSDPFSDEEEGKEGEEDKDEDKGDEKDGDSDDPEYDEYLRLKAKFEDGESEEGSEEGSEEEKDVDSFDDFEAELNKEDEPEEDDKDEEPKKESVRRPLVKKTGGKK